MNVTNVRCPRCRTLLSVPPRAARSRMTCSICLSPVSAAQPSVAPQPSLADTSRICPACAEDRDTHAAGCPLSGQVLEILDDTPTAQAEIRQSSDTSMRMVAVTAVLAIIGMQSMIRGGSGGGSLFVLLTFGFVILIAVLSRPAPPIQGGGLIGDTREPSSPVARVFGGVVAVLGLAFTGFCILGLIAVAYFGMILIAIVSACAGVK